MPVPSPRNKILPARGNYADLLANVVSILDGEMCYAIDQDSYYQKEGGVLVQVGGTVDSVNTQTGAVVLDADDINDTSTIHKFATAAQLAKADNAVQLGSNVSTLTNDAGYITATGTYWTEGTNQLYPSDAGNAVLFGGTLPSAPNITLASSGAITAGTYNTLTVGLGGGSVSTNTAIGQNALLSNSTGVSNTALGQSALRTNSTGVANVAVGLSALRTNTEGNYNTALGQNALFENTTAGQNTAVGSSALQKNTLGDSNTAVGRSALNQNTEGVSNAALGRSALQNNTTGDSNTALGRSALQNNTIGNYNTAIGQNALYNNTEGVQNTAVGRSALSKNTIGDSNIAFGQGALQNNTEGNYNTAFGQDALYSNTTGSYSSALGQNAGYYIEGSNNTVLGAYQGTSADSTLSDTVIISAGTTERMRIDSTGSLLFGGTLPSAPNITLNGSDGSAEFTGDITCTDNSKGLVLKSPDGTSFRLSVANDGTLSATSI
jgi:hypothetical protein